jgi:hypothetical protein
MTAPYFEAPYGTNCVASFGYRTNVGTIGSTPPFSSSLANLALLFITYDYTSSAYVSYGQGYTSSVVSSHLTWSQIINSQSPATVYNPPVVSEVSEVWAASISSALSTEVVTVTASDNMDSVAMYVVGVVGAGSIETYSTAISGASTISTQISTSDPEALIVAFTSCSYYGMAGAIPSGFTAQGQFASPASYLASANVATYSPGTTLSGYNVSNVPGGGNVNSQAGLIVMAIDSMGFSSGGSQSVGIAF